MSVYQSAKFACVYELLNLNFSDNPILFPVPQVRDSRLSYNKHFPMGIGHYTNCVENTIPKKRQDRMSNLFLFILAFRLTSSIYSFLFNINLFAALRY